MHQNIYETGDSPATRVLSNPKFPPGQLVATSGALAALETHGATPLSLLVRHLAGDWGSVPVEDARSNDQALISGGRLLSSYAIGPDSHIWIITERDRSATTLLLPAEY